MEVIDLTSPPTSPTSPTSPNRKRRCDSDDRDDRDTDDVSTQIVHLQQELKGLNRQHASQMHAGLLSAIVSSAVRDAEHAFGDLTMHQIVALRMQLQGLYSWPSSDPFGASSFRCIASILQTSKHLFRDGELTVDLYTLDMKIVKTLRIFMMRLNSLRTLMKAARTFNEHELRELLNLIRADPNFPFVYKEVHEGENDYFLIDFLLLSPTTVDSITKLAKSVQRRRTAKAQRTEKAKSSSQRYLEAQSLRALTEQRIAILQQYLHLDVYQEEPECGSDVETPSDSASDSESSDSESLETESEKVARCSCAASYFRPCGACRRSRAQWPQGSLYGLRGAVAH